MGTRIEKWKKEGVREFVMKVACNQIARNTMEGKDEQSVKLPQESIPVIYQTTLSSLVDTKDLVFLGKKVELY